MEPDESTDVRVARKLGLDALGIKVVMLRVAAEADADDFCHSVVILDSWRAGRAQIDLFRTWSMSSTANAPVRWPTPTL